MTSFNNTNKRQGYEQDNKGNTSSTNSSIDTSNSWPT